MPRILFLFLLGFSFRIFAQSSTTQPLVVCGDGILDIGESCDDGNNASGDGCRADCEGAELCGDGILDIFEECDDGTRSSTCSAACLVIPTITPTTLPETLITQPRPIEFRPTRPKHPLGVLPALEGLVPFAPGSFLFSALGPGQKKGRLGTGLRIDTAFTGLPIPFTDLRYRRTIIGPLSAQLGLYITLLPIFAANADLQLRLFHMRRLSLALHLDAALVGAPYSEIRLRGGGLLFSYGTDTLQWSLSENFYQTHGRIDDEENFGSGFIGSGATTSLTREALSRKYPGLYAQAQYSIFLLEDDPSAGQPNIFEAGTYHRIGLSCGLFW